MILILGGLLAIIFVLLSGIHFYWAIGGKWGFKEALPTTLEGRFLFQPKMFEGIVVGFTLLLMAIFYGIRSGAIPLDLPSSIAQIGGWAIPSIFLLRTLGDFKYVGLFKKVKPTNFSERDTKYFVPICAFLCIAGYWVQYILS